MILVNLQPRSKHFSLPPQVTKAAPGVYLGPMESELNATYWRCVDVSQFTQNVDLCLAPSMVTYHHERPKAAFIVSGRANKFQNNTQQQATSSTNSKELPTITEFNGNLVTTNTSVQTPVNTVVQPNMSSTAAASSNPYAPAQMNLVSGNLNTMGGGNIIAKRGKLVFDDGDGKELKKNKKTLKFDD